MKNVQIRSFFWSVLSCINSKNGKIETIKNSVFGNFSRDFVFRIVKVLSALWDDRIVILATSFPIIIFLIQFIVHGENV